MTSLDGPLPEAGKHVSHPLFVLIMDSDESKAHREEGAQNEPRRDSELLQPASRMSPWRPSPSR